MHRQAGRQAGLARPHAVSCLPHKAAVKAIAAVATYWLMLQAQITLGYENGHAHTYIAEYVSMQVHVHMCNHVYATDARSLFICLLLY